MREKYYILLFSIILISTYFVGCIESNDNKNDFSTVTPEVLLDSLNLAGNYLIKSTNPDGSFVYLYNSSNDNIIDDYNILRHAGTIYSMLKLYQLNKDNELFNAAEKAINYLVSFIQPYNNSSCVVFEDEIKLGGNALTIIAIIEYIRITNDFEKLDILKDLAKYIGHSQKQNGEFISKRYYSSDEISDFISTYYPGEAILSLCRLYEFDRNESWLDIAEKGIKYVISQEKKDLVNCSTTPNHWTLIALNELYRYRSNYTYFDHSLNISECILINQRNNIDRISEKPSWIGSYNTPPRSASTATLSEGLIAAYYLDYDYGEKNMSSRLLYAINLGIKFQLTYQFTNDNIQNIFNIQHSLGGFYNTMNCYDIRIDYVQHNICSMLGLYLIISEKS